jgi:predicted nucleic acid-binding protein
MACADAGDKFHTQASQERDKALQQGFVLVTTDYVADETLTLIRMRLSLGAAQKWWSQVEASERLRWESIDTSRAERARRIFFSHRDKEYSFTDCTSFALMQELKIKQVLTTDKHFRQMGFDVRPHLSR